jgi:hypothetical protein
MATVTVFTNAGKTYIRDKLKEDTSTQPKYVALGTGAGGAAVGDTALTTEVETRATGTMSTPSSYVFQVVGTVTLTTGRTITELGLFDQSAVGGTMLIRSTFTGLALDSGDSIQVTATITIS